MRDRVVQTYAESCRDGCYFELKPGELVLGTTVERIELGPRVCASIEGKSSLGRMGLAVHVTAGFVDPGFRGQITLELFNLSPSTIRLRPGLAVCQVAFSECVTRAVKPYGSPGLGSRYQDQTGAVPVKP
jgi:dCTP deaminase